MRHSKITVFACNRIIRLIRYWIFGIIAIPLMIVQSSLAVDVNLTWDPSVDPESGVSHYNIYREGANIGQTSTLQFTDTNPSVGQLNCYEVSAVNTVNLESEKSSPLACVTVPADPPAINIAPTVNAGADQTIILTGPATLAATVTDDGLPNPPGATTVEWTQESGPGTVTFGNANSGNTTATFSIAGSYVLRLTANDSELVTSDTMNVTVGEEPPPPVEKTYTILRTPNVPIIDGNLSEYADAEVITITGPDGGIGTYRILWDDIAIYIAGSVIDSQLVAIETNHDGVLHRDDGLELMFDTLHDGGTSLDSNDYKFIANLLNIQGERNGTDSNFNIVWNSQADLAGTLNDNTDSDASYTIEIVVPWSSWGVSPPVPGTQWGFDLSLNDRDNSTTTQTAWANMTGGGFIDPNGWGDIVFSSEGLPGDNILPVIVCPANITINNDQGSCDAVATYTPPIGTDNEPGATTSQTTGLGSQASFPVGTTTEEFTVIDADGNTVSCSFTVTVLDNENPIIVCPTDITVNKDSGLDSTAVTYTEPIGTDNCLGASTSLTAGLGSGATFLVGSTTEEFTAIDVAGNTASCSFTVTVTDNEAPVAEAGADQTIMLDNSVSLSGTVTDDGLPNPPASTTIQWTKEGGPGDVSFNDETSASTTATFSAAGGYVLRLTGDDGEQSSFDEVSITVIMEEGLMAYYSFNGNPQDQSGSGNHGEVYGSTLTTGVSGQAYEFDGVNDYIAIQNLQFGQSTHPHLEKLTVGAWIQTTYSSDSWTDNWSIIDFDRDKYFSFYVRGDDGRVGFSTVDGNGNLHDSFGTSAVNDGRWHYVCAVYDGNDKRIYVDAIEEYHFENAHGGNSIGTGDTRYGFIGDGSEAETFNGNRNKFHYQGLLDEIKLYSSALTSAEILAEFEKIIMPDVSNGLLLSYSFDGNPDDRSGGDNHGEVFGASLVSGVTGLAYEFDGDNDYIAIQKLNFPREETTNAITISGWVRTASQGGSWFNNWSLIDFDRNEFFALFIRGDDGRLCFSTTDTGATIQDLTSLSSVNDGQWHFVTAVYNGMDKILYIDGKEDNRLSNAHEGRGLGTGSTVRFGFLGDGSEAASYNGNRNKYFFEGSMDELKLFDRALSSIEIQSSYESIAIPPPNDQLLLSYSFEGDVQETQDGSGNGNHGLVQGGITQMNGAIGSAFSFDGQDDYIAIRNLNFGAQDKISELTACSWINTSYGGGGTFDNWSLIDFDRNEFFSFYLRGDDGRMGFSTSDSEGKINDFYGVSEINDGFWHLACAVYNGRDKILYVDGVEDNRLVNVHNGLSLGSGNTVRFGFIGDGSEAEAFDGERNEVHYEGLLDEVSLFSRPLSRLEISTMFAKFQGQVSSMTIKKSNSSEGNNAVDDTGLNGNSNYPGEPASSTLYENAEDNTTKGWLVYNEGSVENIADGANESGRAIRTIGDIESDVFRLGKEDGSDWNNGNEFFAEFSILFEEIGSGAIYFQLNTSAGIKYLVYADGASTDSSDPDIVHIGLGDVADGEWHKIFRNLEDDMKAYYLDFQMVSVKALFVYGSVLLDDVKLLHFDQNIAEK